jgi:bifunctional non-homologous end joining protein LigD
MARTRLIPKGVDDLTLEVEGQKVRLTNLQKPFWPTITKGDLIQYYAEVARWLLPHVRDRAMVMKRYPHGAAGAFFFMKRAPAPRPDWIAICSIDHGEGKVIDFPMIQDLPSLLWLINLGCIDLNQWYARADALDRPDYLHFDLDPGEASFEQVKETAFLLHDALAGLGMQTFVKTSGSKGLHVYVPLVRGPTQKQVWTAAKTIAVALAAKHRSLMTVAYARDARPPRHVLVDYNQNRWGSTLATIYSVRPTPLATVSTPVTWSELPTVELERYTLHNVPERLARLGDLWRPLAAPYTHPARFDFAPLLPKESGGSSGATAARPRKSAPSGSRGR